MSENDGQEERLRALWIKHAHDIETESPKVAAIFKKFLGGPNATA